MKRVHRVFRHLQPVARIVDGVGHHVIVGLGHGVEHREIRHCLWRPHIGKQQTLKLTNRVSAVT